MYLTLFVKCSALHKMLPLYGMIMVFSGKCLGEV